MRFLLLFDYMYDKQCFSEKFDYKINNFFVHFLFIPVSMFLMVIITIILPLNLSPAKFVLLPFHAIKCF